jgi:hypothetical protein
VKARLALAACALVACAHSTEVDRSRPTGRSPATVDVKDVPVKGFETQVEWEGGPTRTGELLAIDDRSLYLLIDGEIHPIPRAAVTSVSVELYPSHAWVSAGWAAVGTLSTLSHGFYLVFTAPVWVASGVGTSIYASNSNDVEVPNRELGRLNQFARFPQGLPAGWWAKAQKRTAPDAGAPTPMERDSVAPQGPSPF